MKHRRCSICKSNEFFFFPSATFVNKETVCQSKISKSCEISKNNSRTSFGGVSQDIANKNWELRSIISFIRIRTKKTEMLFQIIP